MQMAGALKFFYIHGAIFQPCRITFIKLYMLIQSLKRALSVLGLLLGSQAALAQTILPTQNPVPGWYAGLQAGNSLRAYSIDRQGNGLFTHFLGVHGGYATAARLAFQLGLEYGRGDKVNEERQGSGQYIYYPQTERIIRAWTVPAQLRWSFAKQPHRFQVEGLAGVSACFFRQRATGNNTATATKEVKETNGVNGYLDLGIAGRLRLTPQLALSLDLTTNLNLVHPNNYYLPIAPGFGATLGLYYSFR